MGKDKTGKSLEMAVARIQQMMEVGSVVTHNEYIKDRLGNLRQFDVVIRGLFAGREILGVIECKDWADKVGTPEIDAFITKSRNINANLVLMVSQKGFTAPALVQAKHEGIGTLSLLSDDPVESGFSIGIEWFGHLYRWDNVRANITWAKDIPPDSDARKILFKGKPLINWYLRELSTTYGQVTELGPMHLITTFDSPITVELNGNQHELLAFGVSADRIYKRKRKLLQVSGDGYYDWQKSVIQMAPMGKTTIGPWSGDLSDWDDYDGEMPTHIKQPQAIITSYPHCIDVETKEIVDMSGY